MLVNLDDNDTRLLFDESTLIVSWSSDSIKIY